MRAFHVIGVDLQLWLGIDLRVIGKQQVTVRLLGIGFLRVFVYHDASMEDTMRVAIQNSVVELAAATVRAGMLDVHVIVEMLAAVAEEQPVDKALSTFSGEHGVNVVANQAAAQEERVRGYVGAPSLLDTQSRNIESFFVLLYFNTFSF